MSFAFRPSRIFPALVLLVATTACSSDPAAYAAKGKKAYDARHYAEAEIDYLKAVQMKPAFGEAAYGLGLAQWKQGKLNDAYQNLTHAVEMMPARDDVAASLADLCLAGYLSDRSRPAQLYQEAAATAVNLLKRNPNSYDGIRLNGYIAMMDRRYPEAIDLLRKADNIKPGQGDLTEGLMECLIGNGQGPEAEKVGKEFLQTPAHRTFAPVYDTLYGYFMDNHREGDAEELLKSKVAANPDAANYRLQLARHYLNAGKTVEMKAALQQIVDDAKRFPQGRMTAGNFCLANDRPADALAFFQAGSAQDTKFKTAYQRRTAETLVTLGRPGQALTIIEDVLKTDPNDIDVRTLRASIRLDSNQADSVQTAFQELPLLLKERPNDPALHYNLGRAQLFRGNTDAALSEFREAIRQNPRFLPARVLAANLSMQREDYAQARRDGDAILSLTGSPAAKLLRAAALTGLGNFDEASREVDQLVRQYPAAPEPKLQLAALRLAEKKYPEAEAIYRSLYEANRKDLRPMRGLVDTWLAQNHPETAIQFLTREKDKASSPELEAMLADTALRTNQLDLAVRQYAKMSGANPQSPFEHLRLGDAYLRQGNLRDAITQFQTAKTLAPKEPLANAMLALALHDAGRTDEAQRAYREALALQSGNPEVSNNLAYLMAETGGNLDEALRLAQSANRQQPSNLAFADTIALIYLKKNLPDSAIQILSNATRKEPKQPLYHYHLAMALSKKGDQAGARRECEAALSDGPTQADEQKIRSLLASSAPAGPRDAR